MNFLRTCAVATQIACLTAVVAACSHTGGSADDIDASGVADSIVSQSIIDVDGKSFLRLDINTSKASVELTDSIIPNIDDPNICLCVEAAFTGVKKDSFSAANVAGDYICAGRLRHGYRCEANTGLLYSDSKNVIIAPTDSLDTLSRRAQATGGSLFQQMLLVYNGKDVYHDNPIFKNNRNIYRAICVFDDDAAKDNGVKRPKGFSIIQCRYPVTMDTFMSALLRIGIRHALYLDMGMGWNYGWFRANAGEPARLLFAVRSIYQTNWLVVRAR